MGEIVVSEGQLKWGRLWCLRGSQNGGDCDVRGAVKIGEIVVSEGQLKWGILWCQRGS